MSPAAAGRFFTTEPPAKPHIELAKHLQKHTGFKSTLDNKYIDIDMKLSIEPVCVDCGVVITGPRPGARKSWLVPTGG